MFKKIQIYCSGDEVCFDDIQKSKRPTVVVNTEHIVSISEIRTWGFCNGNENFPYKVIQMSTGESILCVPESANELVRLLEESKHQKSMIQWKGDNLKEVIDFTGKDKNFDKWFKSFEEYEQYVQEHDGIFKLFNADGSHYEVPVGAWIVKTPDGYNVASKAIFKQKSAWSEEDKRKINRIYSILGQAADTHAFSTTCRLIGDKECVDLQGFLKSITLQNTWKPSDEQMDALKKVILCGTSVVECGELNNLHEDLKKLMEK